MAGDLRSSILTTAAVAVSVAGLTVIQPLTAAPPLLLAALLMDGGSGEIDGVGGIAEAIQDRLLPSDGRRVIVNFLSGPFGIWGALDESDAPGATIPSTTLGVASSMPFLTQQGWNVAPPLLPPLAPAIGPAIPPALAAPAPVVAFDIPSLQIGDALVPTPPVGGVPVPAPRDVVTSIDYDLQSYAAITLLNPVALTNSVASYLNRALSPVQVNPDYTVTCPLHRSCDDLDVKTEWVDGVMHVTFKNPDGTLVRAKVETRNGVTYVTYDDDGALPLVRPLRDYFGLLGNELADIIEPALTALVYWGYRDATNGNSGSVLPTPAETIRTLLDFLVGIKEGIASLFVAHTPPISTQTLAADVETTLEETAIEETEVVDPSGQKQASSPASPAEPTDEQQGEIVPDEVPVEDPPVDEPETEPVDDQPVQNDGDDPADDPDTGSDSEDREADKRDSDKPDRDAARDKDRGDDRDRDGKGAKGGDAAKDKGAKDRKPAADS